MIDSGLWPHFGIPNDVGRKYELYPHHWEHWIFPQDFTLPNSDVHNNCLEMPHDYILEMVADWQGASFCQTGSWDITDWLQKQYPRLRLHPKTNTALLEILSTIGIKINDLT